MEDAAAPQLPAPVPIDRWPDAIEGVLARECTVLARLQLLRETASTQDHARRAGARPGDVVAAWRQSAGRGRLGRAWLDTGEDGVAVTFVVPRAAPEFLAMASAVAAAGTIAGFGGALSRAGIKWPNDVVLDGRKLCGILVEQDDGAALVGIGINVRQRAFEAPFDAVATSMAQAGCPADRLDVLCELVRRVDAALRATPEEVDRAYRALDRLSGTRAEFRTPAGTVVGEVRSVDPRRGLHVRTASGDAFLPAATTSVVPPDPARRYGDAHGDPPR
jgi:BirA family biotin operon repressor/biotin-[acetyl-CoA-carboxylase] ligase